MTNNESMLIKKVNDIYAAAAAAKNSNIGALQAEVINYGCVKVNGTICPASVATGVYMKEGSTVWVQMTKDGRAVVIGQ